VLLRNAPTGGAPLLPLDAARVGRVAVIGPLADTVFEDWYSGTLPYAVTAYAGISARLGSPSQDGAAPRTTYVEGVDRIALRPLDGTGYVVAGDGPDGAPLSVQPDATVADRVTWFDVFDWTTDTVALRAVANGRHVAGHEGTGELVNDRPGPGEWVVRETFRLVEDPSGEVAIHHLASDRYVRWDADGVLRADAPDLGEASRFVVEPVVDGIAAAAAAAATADVAVVVLGNHPMVGGRETEDRPDLELPPAQDALLRAVQAANPRTVLVLASSYPYAIGWADQQVPAIVWSAHGGQEYGTGLAAVLFGDADPTGRLTQTWYRSTADLPDLLDYDVISSDATYLYFRGTPLYPFGHGLSYATFAYRNLRLDTDTVEHDGVVEVTVDVHNTGDRPGEQVVQLYTRQRCSRVKQPLRQLRDFARVSLGPGEQATVRLTLRAADLAFWDVTQGRMVVEDARHLVMVGRSATDIVLSATLDVRGERLAPRRPADAPLWVVDCDGYAGAAPRYAHPPAGPVHGDAMAGTEEGGWVAFRHVDFGAGVRSATIRLHRTAAVSVVLLLDDPYTGDTVGSVRMSLGAAADEWVDVWVPVTPVAGVRDLYLRFDTPGTMVSRLVFAAQDGSR